MHPDAFQAPDGTLDLAKQGVKELAIDEYDTDWQGEAYLTVSGQNSNNSVRVTNAFMEAVKATAVKTGVAWADAWNQSIRPAGATVSLLMWVVTMAAAGFVLREFDETLIAAFLGVFVGERIHGSLRSK